MEKFRNLFKNKIFYVLSIFIICLICFICCNKSSKTVLSKYLRNVFKAGENEASYRIEYYFNGSIMPGQEENKSAQIGTVIDSYEPFYSTEEYSTIAILNLPLTISSNENNNVIKVYYEENTGSSNPNPNEPGNDPEENNPVTYKLEYFYDGTKDGTDILTGNVGDFITSETIEEQIDAHKTRGGNDYLFYKLGKDVIELKENDENIIKVIYISDTNSIRYVVDFYYDDGNNPEIDPSKTRIINANLDDTIIVEENSAIQGWILNNKISTGEANSFYEFESVDPEELVISDDVLENNISIVQCKLRC